MLLAQFLDKFSNKLWLVGSRGTLRNRQDSDIDLHIIDMMETDNTFDEIVLWCEQHKIKHYADKWSVGCILIEEQQGFPVPCDIGFWTGIGKRKLQQVETFGVQLYTPTTLDKT